MKTPSDPAVTALLNSGDDYVFFDLWEFTLQGGTVVRWASCQVDVLASGVVYTSGPVIERNTIEETDGIATTNLSLTITADDDDLVLGVPVVNFISNHGLDGARVRLLRGYNPDWTLDTDALSGPFRQACVGTVTRFSGRVTSVPTVEGLSASVDVSSWAALLGTNSPPNLFQSGCNWSLYDTNCGVNPASWQVSATITSSVSAIGFTTGASNPTGYFAQGQVTFTSGALSGLTYTVRQNTDGAITLVSPMPILPSIGDTMLLLPGCDLTRGAGGCAKFSNLARHRGFPFVPPPETAL